MLTFGDSDKLVLDASSHQKQFSPRDVTVLLTKVFRDMLPDWATVARSTVIFTLRKQ